MKQLVTGAAAAAAIIFIAAAVYFKIKTKNVVPPLAQSPRPAISAAGRDWLENVIGISEGILTQMLITTTASGKIADINRDSGEISIDGDYYTGKPGFYTYRGQLKLTGDGVGERFYFSPRRMEIIRVFDANNQQISFDDLRIGDTVDIEETVNLAAPNQNDANVLSLSIRII